MFYEENAEIDVDLDLICIADNRSLGNACRTDNK